jgi:hypothetical protein
MLFKTIHDDPTTCLLAPTHFASSIQEILESKLTKFTILAITLMLLNSWTHFMVPMLIFFNMMFPPPPAVLRCRQVDDFALGTTNSPTATKIYDAIGKHLQLPNEPVAPFVSQGVISSCNSVDFLQSRHYIKLSAKTYT